MLLGSIFQGIAPKTGLGKVFLEDWPTFKALRGQEKILRDILSVLYWFLGVYGLCCALYGVWRQNVYI